MAKYTISTNRVADLLFTAETLPEEDGSFEVLTIGFGEIGTKYHEEDFFWYRCENGRCIACRLSSLQVAVVEDPVRDAASEMLKQLEQVETTLSSGEPFPDAALPAIRRIILKATGKEAASHAS